MSKEKTTTMVVRTAEGEVCFYTIEASMVKSYMDNYRSHVKRGWNVSFQQVPDEIQHLVDQWNQDTGQD